MIVEETLNIRDVQDNISPKFTVVLRQAKGLCPFI